MTAQMSRCSKFGTSLLGELAETVMLLDDNEWDVMYPGILLLCYYLATKASVVQGQWSSAWLLLRLADKATLTNYERRGRSKMFTTKPRLPAARRRQCCFWGGEGRVLDPFNDPHAVQTDCTVNTIAHRLGTIVNSSRAVVLVRAGCRCRRGRAGACIEPGRAAWRLRVGFHLRRKAT